MPASITVFNTFLQEENSGEQRLLSLDIRGEAEARYIQLRKQTQVQNNKDGHFLEKITSNLGTSWCIWIKRVQGRALANYKLLGLGRSTRENVPGCRWSEQTA